MSSTPVAAIATSRTVAPTVLRPLARPREIRAPAMPPGGTVWSNSGRSLEIDSRADAAKTSNNRPITRESGVRKERVRNRRQAVAKSKNGQEISSQADELKERRGHISADYAGQIVAFQPDRRNSMTDRSGRTPPRSGKATSSKPAGEQQRSRRSRYDRELRGVMILALSSNWVVAISTSANRVPTQSPGPQQ